MNSECWTSICMSKSNYKTINIKQDPILRLQIAQHSERYLLKLSSLIKFRPVRA